MAGGSDLIQRLRDQFRIVPVVLRDIGVSHDGVHGGPDIVGHVGEEIVFRAGAGLSHPLPVLLLTLHLGVNVVGTDDQVASVPVFQQRRLHTDIHRSPFHDKTVFHGKAAVPLQDGHDLFLVEGPHKAVPVLRINDAVHVSPAQSEEIVSLFLNAELAVLLR